MKKLIFILLTLISLVSCINTNVEDSYVLEENHSYLYDVSGTITLYDSSSAEGTTINLEKGLALVEWQKNPNSNYTTYYLDTTISYVKASSKITENLQMEITKINGDYIEISEENFVINGNIEANTFSMTKDEVYQLNGLYSGEMLTITFTRK